MYKGAVEWRHLRSKHSSSFWVWTARQLSGWRTEMDKYENLSIPLSIKFIGRSARTSNAARMTRKSQVSYR